MGRLTLKDIEALIVKEEAYTVGVKTTVVCLTLINGFEVIGSSACVDPTEYDLEKGKLYARSRAIEKVWEVAGYHVQATAYEAEMYHRRNQGL